MLTIRNRYDRDGNRISPEHYIPKYPRDLETFLAKVYSEPTASAEPKGSALALCL